MNNLVAYVAIHSPDVDAISTMKILAFVNNIDNFLLIRNSSQKDGSDDDENLIFDNIINKEKNNINLLVGGDFYTLI